jgi:hydrogenase maturation protease
MGERLLIGIGNAYRRDDGVGLSVIDALEGSLPPDVRLVHSDGDPSMLLDLWAGSPLTVVVDAVLGGGKPGTIYRFNGRDRLPAPFFHHSTHVLGLSEAVDLARALEKLPDRLTIVGVEAGSMEHGKGLTPPVMRAVDRVADLVRRLFEQDGETHGSESPLGVGHA